MVNHQNNGPVGPTPNSFAQSAAVYGLHPLVALVIFVVDQMLFASEISTGFVLAVLSFFVGLALVLPIALLQRHSYGDPWGAAIAKGMIAGILTAIPTGLPGFITATWGVVGAIGWNHRPARRDTIDTTGSDAN